MLDPALRERDLATVRIDATDPLLGNEPVDVYVAEDGDMPVAVVFATTATEGYNSTIHLMIGVSRDGVLTGVRAVSHRETPGLGDAIDIQKSKWITHSTANLSTCRTVLSGSSTKTTASSTRSPARP